MKKPPEGLRNIVFVGATPYAGADGQIINSGVDVKTVDSTEFDLRRDGRLEIAA
jgi:hypothetical protein